MKKSNKPILSFKDSLTYVLDLCAYVYYCKADNLIGDRTFDDLEKMYESLFKEPYPMRAQEAPEAYSNGVRAMYDVIKKGWDKKEYLWE